MATDTDPKYIKARQIIIDGLQLYDNYEKKHKYLQNLTATQKRVMQEVFPDIQKEVNEHMITVITNEFGDPSSDNFTFSKHKSDDQILRELQTEHKNEKYLKSFRADITPELANELMDLTFKVKDKNTGEIVEKSFKDNITHGRKVEWQRNWYFEVDDYKLHGTEAFNAVVALKNKRSQEIKDDRNRLVNNITTLRQEFDDRSGYGFQNKDGTIPWGKSLRYIPGGMAIPEIGKLVMQLGGGWTDIGRHKGLEQVENRVLNWDPQNQRYGPGPEIKNEQDKLRDVYAREDKFKDKFAGIDTKYNERLEMIDQAKNRADELSEKTGIDQALNYIESESKIIELLKGT